jgi:hypothetical protein
MALVETLVTGFRRIRERQPGWVRDGKRALRRESSRVAVDMPVTISGVGEDRRTFSEATHTINLSRRGARIATSKFITLGSHLWVESQGLATPVVARVVRHAVPTYSRHCCEIGVNLPHVYGARSVWAIKSPPIDWHISFGQATAADRLEHLVASGWARDYESIAKLASSAGSEKCGESQREPSSLEPKALASSSES